MPDLPDVATMSEQGVGDIEVRSSLPLYGQKDLPAPIVERLSKAIAAMLANADMRTRLEAAYIQPLPMTAAAMAREHERLGTIIRQLGHQGRRRDLECLQALKSNRGGAIKRCCFRE